MRDSRAENYMNLEVRKILEWAMNNKSNVVLMSRRRRRVKDNKILKEDNSIKYLGIML